MRNALSRYGPKWVLHFLSRNRKCALTPAVAISGEEVASVDIVNELLRMTLVYVNALFVPSVSGNPCAGRRSLRFETKCTASQLDTQDGRVHPRANTAKLLAKFGTHLFNFREHLRNIEQLTRPGSVAGAENKMMNRYGSLPKVVKGTSL